MLLLIDNYDSFTYNLAQYLGELGAEVRVERNDQISVGDIEKLAPAQIVISPGPCTPNEAGISLEVIRQLSGKIPILGVCLGHQAIGQAFGGKVIRANKVMHGKVSQIVHDQRGLFEQIANPMEATRYHSLVVERASFPESLRITATCDDEVMALEHRTLPVWGVQFHPESILTRDGKRLLKNFLQLSRT
jgi:anthranilate synthase/aminodeoxychorismate synthase-like glutamine amidotransferase